MTCHFKNVCTFIIVLRKLSHYCHPNLKDAHNNVDIVGFYSLFYFILSVNWRKVKFVFNATNKIPILKI